MRSKDIPISYMDIITDILYKSGYKTLKLNIPNPAVNILELGNEGFVTVTVDETKSPVFSSEQFRHISEQLRSFLAQGNSNIRSYHFLYIIISDDDHAPERLLGGHESYWRIVPAMHNRLMVYETTHDEFMKLRVPLENVLSSIDDTVSHNSNHLSANTPYKETSIFDNRKSVGFTAVNIAIIIINIIVFLFTDILSSDGSNIIDSGSLSWTDIVNSHEYYRLFTSMFLHGGLDHIFNNMLVLLFIGSYLEQVTGKINYLIIYFSSGIIAGCTSMVYNMMRSDITSSIGASGAIFGVVGGLLSIILIKRRRSSSLDLRKILFMAFLSLYSGFTSQGVDNAAHIGGFIGGFLVTSLIYLIKSKRKAGTFK